MNKLEQAARQALEALDWLYKNPSNPPAYILPNARNALREALAEQEKPLYRKVLREMLDAHEQAEQPVGDGICLTAMLHPHNCCVLVDDVSEDSIEQVEQAEQEPVAWMNAERNTITWEKIYPNMEPLYAAPVSAKREWVELTDDEIDLIEQQVLSLIHI